MHKFITQQDRIRPVQLHDFVRLGVLPKHQQELLHLFLGHCDLLSLLKLYQQAIRTHGTQYDPSA